MQMHLGRSVSYYGLGVLLVGFLLFWGPFYTMNAAKLAFAISGGAGAAVWILFRGPFGSARGRSRETWLLAWILGLPILFALPGVLLQGPSYSFETILSIKLMGVFWGLVAIAFMPRPGIVSGTIRMVGLGVGLLAILALGDLVDIWPGSLASIVEGGKLTFGNQNYGAGVFLLLLPLYLSLALRPYSDGKIWRMDRARIFHLGIVFLLLSLLFYTGSRAGIAIGIFLTWMVGMLFLFRSWREGLIKSPPIFLGSLTLALPLLGLIGAISLKWRDFSALFDPASWEGRLLPWSVAVESIRAAPLIGHGLGSSYDLFFKFLPHDARLFTDKISYKHVHNEHLEIIQDGGILGYVLTIGLIIWLLRRLYMEWKRRPASSIRGCLAVGLAVAIMAFYLHGIVSVAQRMMVTNLFYGFLVGSSIVLLRPQKSPIGKDLPLAKAIFPAGIGISLMAGFFFALTYLHGEHRHFEALKDLRHKADLSGHKQFIERLRDSDNIYALYDVALASRRIGDSENGLKTVEKISHLIPSYRSTDYLKSLFLLQQGRLNEASEALEESIERDPYNTQQLAARIALAVHFNQYEIYWRDLGRSLLKIILSTPQFDHLGEAESEVAFAPEMDGLLMPIVTPKFLTLQVNTVWGQNLFLFLQEELTNPQGTGSSGPSNYTRQLIPEGAYGRLPFVKKPPPSDPDLLRQINSWYSELQRIRIETRNLKTQPEYRALSYAKRKQTRQKLQEKALQIRQRLAKSVDLRVLEQRQNAIDQIITFVGQISQVTKQIGRSIEAERTKK